MSDTTYAYPFDPTGTAQTNKITSESQAISAPDWSEFYFIIPQASPFFRESLVIYHHPSGRRLHEGVDYLPTHRFHDASLATGKPVYGSITFYDKTLSGVVEMSYQTVGGAWTLDSATIMDILSNKIQNPRITTWEQVVELPERFPVIDHEWDLDDMVGMSEVVNAIGGIEQALRDSDDSNFASHLSDFDNPHKTTKDQVGLGNVQNYAIASVPQATDGTSNAVYMTPLRTAQAITAQAVNPLNSHMSDQSNPHNVTKAQLGLGLVPNYGVATEQDAIEGTSPQALMTPQRTTQAIQALALAQFNLHTSDQDNPHNVTKGQVGLGNVQNYPTASVEEARGGMANDRYMTPLLVREAILSTVAADITGHVNNLNNPHQVSKAQVGLGNVQNYPVATEAIALEGESDVHYMTALRVRNVLNSALDDTILPHLNDTDNPHMVTKAQVGLGNVDNFPTASVDDMLQGNSSVMFATPAGVRALINTIDAGGISDHITNTDNPHQVNKNQVGLGNVQNYPLADQVAAEDGTSNAAYMTPLRVRQALEAHPSFLSLEEHLNDDANPHNVTKDQVGLGNVENYAPLLPEDLDEVTELGQVPLDRTLTPQTFQVMSNLATSGLRQDVEDHSNRLDNPHQVTASQTGAYTAEETDDLLETALQGKLDADAVAADSHRLEGFSFADLRDQLENVYRYAAVRPYTVVTPADPEDPEAEDEEVLVNNGPTWTRLAYFDLTFQSVGPNDTVVFEPVDPILFKLAGGEGSQGGEADVYEVSIVPHAPTRSRYRQMTMNGTPVVLLQRTLSSPIDFGEDEPNNPDPTHPSNYTYWYELWSQDPIQRNMIEINTTRFPITSTFFTPSAVAQDTMPTGLSAIQLVIDSASSSGEDQDAGTVDFDIANVADDPNTPLGIFTFDTVPFSEQITQFTPLVLGTDGQIHDNESFSPTVARNWAGTRSSNRVGFQPDPLDSGDINHDYQYLTISDSQMTHYAVELLFRNDYGVPAGRLSKGVAMGVCIAHVMRDGKSHGLYVYRTDGGIDGAGLLVAGYNLFQPDQEILESTNELLRWGDGIVDPERDPATYHLPVAENGNIVGTSNTGQEMKFRISKIDGQITIEVTEFGVSNYASGPSFTIDLSDHPKLMDLFGQDTHWGLSVRGVWETDVGSTNRPGMSRPYYASGTPSQTTTSSMLSDYLNTDPESNHFVRRYESSGIPTMPHITYSAAIMQPANATVDGQVIRNPNSKRVNWKNRLIYSPVSGKLYLGRADGGLRHLLIDADSLNGETVLTP